MIIGVSYVCTLTSSPFTETVTRAICLHEGVPFTHSHAGGGRQRQDLLTAHVHFCPDVVQHKSKHGRWYEPNTLVVMTSSPRSLNDYLTE